MIKEVKAELECILRDKKTGADLLTFAAQSVSDPVFEAGFEGGGVASGNQSWTIKTEAQFDFKAHQHNLLIDGRQWLIVSVTPSARKRLGAGFAAKPRFIYILDLA